MMQWPSVSKTVQATSGKSMSRKRVGQAEPWAARQQGSGPARNN
jgi:hypothetical protein